MDADTQAIFRAFMVMWIAVGLAILFMVPFLVKFLSRGDTRAPSKSKGEVS